MAGVNVVRFGSVSFDDSRYLSQGELSERLQVKADKDAVVPRNSTVINLTDYSSLADAITAAQATGNAATVYVPPGSHDVADRTQIPSGITIRGDGPTSVLSCSASQSVWLDLDGGLMVDVCVDTGGNVSSTIVQVGADDSTMRRVKVVDNYQTATFGVDANGQYSGTTVEDCRFVDVSQPIRIRGVSSNVDILRNRITGWNNRGIFFQGTDNGGTTNSRVSGNVITDMKAGGASRYPIRFEQGSGTQRHAEIFVTDNYVKGPGTSYNDTTTPGTADQISITHADGVICTGNTSIDGGDAGFTLSDDTNVVFTGNRAEYADSTGCYIGSVSGGATSGAAVLGNVAYNCGQNRNGDRSLSRSAFRVTANNATFAGNSFVDDQTTPTMTYGCSIRDSDGLMLGPNQADGVTTLYYSEQGNTNLNKVSTEALA